MIKLGRMYNTFGQVSDIYRKILISSGGFYFSNY